MFACAGIAGSIDGAVMAVAGHAGARMAGGGARVGQGTAGRRAGVDARGGRQGGEGRGGSGGARPPWWCTPSLGQGGGMSSEAIPWHGRGGDRGRGARRGENGGGDPVCPETGTQKDGAWSHGEDGGRSLAGQEGSRAGGRETLSGVGRVARARPNHGTAR
ncbi:hypothetical protein BS78_04G132600 [Paspalum vaginatum]|nr:hypothetical protein BS78_04G132600 [Paspalum vaginatum]